jgi:hypothetical protein
MRFGKHMLEIMPREMQRVSTRQRKGIGWLPYQGKHKREEKKSS